MNDIDSLRLKQSYGAKDLISTLRTIEINGVDICNRSCNFCPQSDDYRPRKGFLKLSIVEKIAKDLEKINFTGRVTFTGFGEPLLYKNLASAIQIIKKNVISISYIEVVTNGDYLTKEKILELSNSGCTNITISMYDGDMSEKFYSLFQGSNIELTLKHSYNGFKTVDRNNIIFYNDKLNVQRQCYLPFYKMMIDIDGNVLVCANDWGRKAVVGNVITDSIIEIWLNKKIQNFRNNLIKGNRKNCIPCKYCDVDGTVYGKESVSIFENV